MAKQYNYRQCQLTKGLVEFVNFANAMAVLR